MILIPYNEIISLHDMNILDFNVDNTNAYIKLNQAILLDKEGDFILDNPTIIVNDLIYIKANEDYPIRIKLVSDTSLYTITPKELKNYKFTILEEAYGLRLLHFYGIATKDGLSFDCFIDIHYGGDLKVEWEDKTLLEAKYDL